LAVGEKKPLYLAFGAMERVFSVEKAPCRVWGEGESEE
jgi:hypothetical protein